MPKFLRQCATIADRVIPMSIKTYSELCKLKTFEERYRYLRLNGVVGQETFGYERILNQVFYQRSDKWKSIRDKVIIRDNGCDLGMEGHVIYGRILVHHMNPVTIDDLETESEYLLDPEFLICTTHSTHNAIHYGDESLLPAAPITRYKNDTCPWKHD